MSQAPIPQIRPHPRPQSGRCCVSWAGITKGTPSRVSLPHPDAGVGAGKGEPPGLQGGPRKSHSPSTVAPATIAESRGSSSSHGGVSMVWAVASSSPRPPVLLLLVLVPPPIGGSPLYLPLPGLFYSYPFPLAKRTRGVGEKAQFRAPREGPADAGAPPAPQIRTLHPGSTPRSLFPLPGAKAHSPISEPPPAAKMHNWEEAGWGVGGVDPMGGCLG